MDRYQEPPETGTIYREKYLEQLHGFLACEEEKATARRKTFFQPDWSSISAYESSLEPFRQKFKAMLGWPLSVDRPSEPDPVRMDWVAEDSLGTIYRAWIETLPGLETYGLFFLPPGPGPHPLVISQHGGLGTPEICSGLFDSANYNDMSRRLWKLGNAVFAPQLLMWRDTFGPKFDRAEISARLRSLGGSLTALELWQLQRSLDTLGARPEVDAGRMGIVGLSFGGFFAQFLAAVDGRVRSMLCSCMLYDQPGEGRFLETWHNVAATFGFAEVTGLIAPRAFYLETGQTDDLIPASGAPPLVAQARAIYARLGIPERFTYTNHPGWHEFDKAEDGLEFFQRHL